MHLYVITGASRGLGWALAKALAGQPDLQVLAISRAGVPEPHAAVQDLRCDLSTLAGQQEAAAAIAARLAEGRWTRAVLINNAGMVEPVGPVERLGAEDIARSVALNLAAPLVLMQAFLAHSGAIESRHIINISSGAARRPVTGWAAYCATKAGLDMATRVALAEAERAGRGVHATSLAPGVVDTAMQSVIRGARAEDFPDVADFRNLKEQGLLQSAEAVALRIIELERSGKLPDGLADLRQL